MKMLGRIGRQGRYFFNNVASFSYLSMRTFYWTFFAPFRGKGYPYREVVFQMNRVGVQSFLIVALIAFLIGMILCLQSAYVVEPYGQLEAVPGGVAVSLTREIGPLMVAIVVTGRVGAAYAAELGAQRVSEEITALQCMAINPIGFLIAPRFLALLIMLPVLTVYGNTMGILGGYVMGVGQYGIAHSVYMDNTFEFLKNKDVLSGILKSILFAFIISMVGCYKGFTVKGGSTGVGKATMEAVVASLVLIIAGDAIFTAFITQYW